jgi:hypothetical protein
MGPVRTWKGRAGFGFMTPDRLKNATIVVEAYLARFFAPKGLNSPAPWGRDEPTPSN